MVSDLLYIYVTKHMLGKMMSRYEDIADARAADKNLEFLDGK